METHTPSLTVSTRSSAQPFCQMAHEVKEEVALRNADDLIADHNEQGESLGAGETEPIGDGATEVLCPSTGINFESLQRSRAAKMEQTVGKFCGLVFWEITALSLSEKEFIQNSLWTD